MCEDVSLSGCSKSNLFIHFVCHQYIKSLSIVVEKSRYRKSIYVAVSAHVFSQSTFTHKRNSIQVSLAFLPHFPHISVSTSVCLTSTLISLFFHSIPFPFSYNYFFFLRFFWVLKKLYSIPSHVFPEKIVLFCAFSLLCSTVLNISRTKSKSTRDYTSSLGKM